ncbi:MAG: VCBS repeat-containing protein [Pirellulales bacterium]|nr:VCBS repeat-containing protein [Pirellulales bacterium]
MRLTILTAVAGLASSLAEIGFTTEPAEGEAPSVSAFPKVPGRLVRLKYRHPGLVVDLGVGLWATPIPVDFDGDGDYDLAVSCPDVPSNGVCFFENIDGNRPLPRFKPGKRISRGLRNVGSSYFAGACRVLTPGVEYPDFLASGLDRGVPLPVGPNVHDRPVRSNQWKYVDYDGDGHRDLIVGVGDWTDYGWDNAYDARGRWTRGPLHGYVYLLHNGGTDEKPVYDPPRKIEADGRPIDTYGMPCPCLADFDADGDLDLICGEFLDGFTYFENIGTRRRPRFAAPRPLTADGRPLRMDLCMITPAAVDWDRNGTVDLIVGQEDGRVALLENTGKLDGRLPVFKPPRFFQQIADDVKFGVLATPVSFDWDGDGDEDLLCGNSAGYIGWIENLDGGNPPQWAASKYLAADGKTIRIQAGPNGSIQGPAEARWGYTTLSAADWDQDGLPDLIVNSIRGSVLWYRNTGTRTAPKLSAAQPIEVQWPGKPPKPAWNWWESEGKQLVTQWRTTPAALDWNGDGLCDLIMLDHEGYLAFFKRARVDGRLVLLPPRRVFYGDAPRGNGIFSGRNSREEPLRLNPRSAGGSGRRKFCFADWDGDGRLDLLIDGKNVDWMRNVSSNTEKTIFKYRGPLGQRILAGHDTSPTPVGWAKDGVPDLLIGAEDGYFYLLRNPRHANP